MSPKISNFEMEAIGYIHCDQRYRYEAPRQGIFAKNTGIIKLETGKGFDQALKDLNGFERIWVLFAFHLNCNWRPLVQPPVTCEDKKNISLFATRSPHRPNRIGISCVELERVDGLNVYIRNFDMLDLTPVLDIKPYVPLYDSFPDSGTGWIPALPAEHKIVFKETAEEKAEFIYQHSKLDLRNFCHVQLASEPLNPDRKRISKIESKENMFMIACRTWRISFRYDSEKDLITVTSIDSGYSAEELAPGSNDRYEDKDLHREFNRNFAY